MHRAVLPLYGHRAKTPPVTPVIQRARPSVPPVYAVLSVRSCEVCIDPLDASRAYVLEGSGYSIVQIHQRSKRLSSLEDVLGSRC